MRILCALPLALLTLISILGAAPANAENSGDFAYTVTNGKVTITHYHGFQPEVTFPATIKGLPVTRLADNVFYFELEASVVHRIDIPASVTRIDKGFFNNVSELQQIVVDPANASYKSVSGILYDKPMTTLIKCPESESGVFTIPNGVETIAFSAFSGAGLTEVNCPDSLTRIGGDAFSFCRQLESATLPAGLREIGNRAFTQCSALKSAPIPASVRQVGDMAFYGCESLTQAEIPALVTKLGNQAFSHCGALSNVSIHTGVKRIGNGAFGHCGKLTGIEIPEGLETIGRGAFFSSGLLSVKIPASVTQIGLQAFGGCADLTSIKVAPANPRFAGASGLLLNKSKTVVLTCPGGISGMVDLPGSVSLIKANAFEKCSGLTGIQFPAGLAEIGDRAFGNCNGLKQVALPGSVSRIGDRAFEECVALEALTLGKGLEQIGERAFFGCESLVHLTIPRRVTRLGSLAFAYCAKLESAAIRCGTLGESAFLGCGSLAQVSLGADIRVISASAFEGCGSLLNVTIPAGATTIGGSAFAGCGNLTSIGIPASISQIKARAFTGCHSLGSIELPLQLSSIEDYVFSGCESLTSVSIPGKVSRIGREAFFGCKGLRKITLRSGLARIEVKAFTQCTSLKKVTFPASIARITSDAFHNSGLEGAYFKGNAPQMGLGVFEGTTAGFTVYFLKSKTGFTTPTWKGYPAVGLDALPGATAPAGSMEFLAKTVGSDETPSFLLGRRPAPGGMVSPRVAKGKVSINGRQYLTLTYQEPVFDDGVVRIVEVSSNLVDWFSGVKHTVEIARRGGTITVRDWTPISPESKRHIRLRTLE